MRIIYKYNLKKNRRLSLPKGYKILNAIEQYEQIVVYCLIDPHETEKEEVQFYILGTGWEIEDVVEQLDYVNTVSTHGGVLIWHIFKNNSQTTELLPSDL